MEEDELMWSGVVHGSHSSKSLLNVAFYHDGKKTKKQIGSKRNRALWSANKWAKTRAGTWWICLCWEWVKESQKWATKLQGTQWECDHLHYTCTVYMAICGSGYDHCHVYLFDLYLSKLLVRAFVLKTHSICDLWLDQNSCGRRQIIVYAKWLPQRC